MRGYLDREESAAEDQQGPAGVAARRANDKDRARESGDDGQRPRRVTRSPRRLDSVATMSGAEKEIDVVLRSACC